MQEQRSSGCCLWSSILVGLSSLLVCACACCLLVLIIASRKDGEIDLNFLVTPTPINTCEGLLENIHQTPSGNQNIQVDQRYILNVYQVNGDQISGPEKKPVPENLIPLQDDLAAQQLIWDYFVYIIPSVERQPLTEYRIFSDGSGKTNGYYEIKWEWQGEQESQTWALEMDLADYQDLKSINDALIHEFGHMLTLNLDQINIRTKPATCQFYTDDNCSFENSYLNQFFDAFWAGSTYAEWIEITSQPDQEVIKSKLTDFYQAHPQDFVREYAATAPKEDLADTWAYFVMTSTPSGETLAEQKILFFYNFPEFVALRSQIRSNICQYYHIPE